MVRRNAARLVVALVGVIALLAGGQTGAFAAPTNDDYSAATAVETLPFTTTVDTTGATTGPTDPTTCSNNGSVWFSYTPPTSMRIQADTFGSDYDTVLSAWSGGPGSYTSLGCNDDTRGLQSQVTFTATAGTTYHFMVALCCGNGRTGGGSLRFSVAEIQPAVNDDVADALPVGTLPYSNIQDLSSATSEAGEPTSCFSSARTVWYSYTPTVTGSVTANSHFDYLGLAVYTGSSPGDLTQVACRSLFQNTQLTFRAEAGTTYLFQLGADSAEQTTFQLDVAQNPTAVFYSHPEDPSSFDTMIFSPYVTEPGGVGIASYTWDFGDGATSTSVSPKHRYAADGDYTVRLTLRTHDGRTGSVTNVVTVRTHDVSIVRLNVPATAKAGQSITINVNVQNTRYEEDVLVNLEKSSPSGYLSVGSLTQRVAVKATGQTTRFSFDYTVTAEDQATGKITFRAQANIVGHRDALPADNELLSTPVKVS
ncbi:PKD domain-containing protein [Micromonospora sp. NPDC004540]|uniref:PKD domain-containing protein n=1 Tax=Micromonospora sp. NPDC004540 TaxID=3154457 RepID=UPI00339FFBA4